MNESAGDRDAMTLRELAAWAWTITPPQHLSRANLLIHLVAVPLFVLGHVGVLIGILMLSGRTVLLGVFSIILSMTLQARGHALEQTRVPFASKKDFVRRFYVEQFYIFWRFLFSGHWYANFRHEKPSL